MAAMVSLQSSFTSLSLPSNSFLGQRVFPSTSPSQVKTVDHPPCVIVMRLKRWERKDCKPNSLPLLHKMHVKVGDTVKVIAGGEKGKIGEITQIFKHNSTVIIKDINLKTKHVKSKAEGEQGQIIKKEVASRVGHQILEDGRKVRYLIKTGEIIDTPERWKEIQSKKESETAIAAPAS
ncbi:50S ribosomal protein L24 chloroplastic [Bienertia sinuspersici]